MIRLGIIWLMLVGFHPVHVSLASLNYDHAGGKFNLFLKVYTDDLENDCRLMTGDSELLLYHNGFTPDSATLNRYVSEKLVIEIDGERLEAFVAEVDSDAEELRIRIEYNCRGSIIKRIGIENRVMTDLYSDQVNLFIVRIDDWEEGVKFTPEYTKHIINR